MNATPARAPLAARELLLAALLALTAGLAWWWQQATKPPEPPPPPAERRPDYVVDGLRAVTMDADGRPVRRLVATQLRHYPQDGSSELDAPVLLAWRLDDADDDADQRADAAADAPGPPWQVEGDTGWITAAGDELLLQGNVVISREATGDAPPLRLTSTELLVLPDTEYAETARFATLTAGADWVTAAGGLRVWFGPRLRTTLFGRVHAGLTARAGGPSPRPPAGLPAGLPAGPPAGPAAAPGTPR